MRHFRVNGEYRVAFRVLELIKLQQISSTLLSREEEEEKLPD